METTTDRRAPLAVHGLGRHRRRLDDGGRRAAVAADRGGRRQPTLDGPHLRPDQRQPHRLQQGRQHRRAGARCRRRSRRINARCPSAPAFVLHTGDITPPVEARGVRHRRPAHRRVAAAGLLRPRRARRAGRRRRALPRALRQGHAGRRLVQLRPQRRALHRPGQRRQPQGRRPGQARRRAARMARGRPRRPLRQHADRRLRPHPAVVGLPRVGLGHRGQRRRRWPISSGSARSPCSTATSTR